MIFHRDGSHKVFLMIMREYKGAGGQWEDLSSI